MTYKYVTYVTQVCDRCTVVKLSGGYLEFIVCDLCPTCVLAGNIIGTGASYPQFVCKLRGLGDPHCTAYEQLIII